MSASYDRVAGAEEHILQLSNGRQLAYAHNGPPASRTVVLFFSGLLSVGKAVDVPDPCRELGIHWIAPTPMGMGNSSPRNPGEAYHVALTRDMIQLLSHLYPDDGYDRLYVAGGSYGSVPAQMLYGAPYELFPAGRKIVGGLFVAGFSPFRYHAGYASTLSWHTWFSVGPPTRVIPFQLIQRLFSSILAPKVKSLEGAKTLLNEILFSKMDAEEKAVFKTWAESKGRTEDGVIANMAEGAVRSTNQWEGFIEVSDVVHSDWGFDPARLDEEHASKPVLVVGSEKDDMGGATNAWMAANYSGAKLRVVPGGHISALFYMDGIWSEMIEMSRPE